MAEKFLDRAKVRPVPQKVRCKGMAKRMRRHMRRKVELQTQRFDKALCRTGAEPFATGADKQRPVRRDQGQLSR